MVIPIKLGFTFEFVNRENQAGVNVAFLTLEADHVENLWYSFGQV